MQRNASALKFRTSVSIPTRWTDTWTDVFRSSDNGKIDRVARFGGHPKCLGARIVLVISTKGCMEHELIFVYAREFLDIRGEK